LKFAGTVLQPWWNLNEDNFGIIGSVFLGAGNRRQGFLAETVMLASLLEPLKKP
jgi:hypothetical protein